MYAVQALQFWLMIIMTHHDSSWLIVTRHDSSCIPWHTLLLIDVWPFQYSVQQLLNKPAFEGKLFLSLTLSVLVLSKFHKSQPIMKNRVSVSHSRPSCKNFLKFYGTLMKDMKAGFSQSLRDLPRWEDVARRWCPLLRTRARNSDLGVGAPGPRQHVCFEVVKCLQEKHKNRSSLIAVIHLCILRFRKFVHICSIPHDSLIGLFRSTPNKCMSYNCIGLAATYLW